MPTGEQKHGSYGVGLRRKKGVIGCGIKKNDFLGLGVNFPKRGSFGVNFVKFE